jgi:alkylation response protein AidB-like acyl-CoA dehydrogenase
VDDELARFEATVDAAIERYWGNPTAAGTGDLERFWSAAADLGWYELSSVGAVRFAIAATRRLGRAACPLPLLDGYAAAQLMASTEIASGRARIVVTADAHAPVDAAGAATHVLLVPAAGGDAELHPITSSVDLPGLAVPGWTQVRLGQPVCSIHIDQAQADRVLALTRLGRAVRALGAAEHAHELAVQHAKTRRQFGKTIGGFGAVQQRIAQSYIEIRAADLLVQQAVSALGADSASALLSSEIAVSHIAAYAPAVQLAAHHTLAASGYFEEHPAPWLFRRVHADVTMLQPVELAQGSVGDVLVETRNRLPELEYGANGESFRRQFLTLITEHGLRDKAPTPVLRDEAAVSAIAAEGWFSFGWASEYGGRNASLAEQMILNEETTYHRVGATRALASVLLIAAAILRHGSPEQKKTFLPIIGSGQMNFCLGYSESEAGSDLASLRTQARRDGDEWVINGQKMWTTDAHQSDWVWLAARTDAHATPPQAGITIFLFKLTTQGITIHQHTALSGEVSATVFYDDVRVPDSARIGEVNGGWAVITDALAGERIIMGNIAAALRRQLDDLLDVVHAEGDRVAGARGSATRSLITDLAVRIQATRALVTAAVVASTSNQGAVLDAALAGVMGGDLAEDFGEAMLRIFGPAAALGRPSAAVTFVPGGGQFEYGLRQSIMYVVGGGTNDVQRGLIARRLGLPRA